MFVFFQDPPSCLRGGGFSGKRRQSILVELEIIGGNKSERKKNMLRLFLGFTE